MKTIKIYAIPSHDTPERTSGVDFARIIQPMEHLHGYELNGYRFEVKIYRSKDDPTHLESWDKVAENYDIVYLNYTADAWAFAAMGTMMRKHNRIMIMDTDDALWYVQPDNPSSRGYYKGSEALRNFNAMCDEVDYMTTTNNYLKNMLVDKTRKRHEEIKVFPNYIDFDLYRFTPPFKNDGQIQLLHFGSTTHFNDLIEAEFAKGIDMVFSEYPNVTLKTVGAFLPNYKARWGQRYSNAFGDVDLYKWVNEKFPLYMAETDILVTPLADNLYTRCKSSIKWLEGSSAKRPGVWADMRQYREVIKDGENGFIARYAEGWYQSIKTLMGEPKLRKKMGENAYRDVKKGWLIKDRVKDYAEWFIRIYNLWHEGLSSHTSP